MLGVGGQGEVILPESPNAAAVQITARTGLQRCGDQRSSTGNAPMNCRQTFAARTRIVDVEVVS